MAYGADFAGTLEIDAGWTYRTGTRQERIALIEAIVRRLTTPRGGLFYRPDYGFDVRALVADVITRSQAETMIQAEILAEERVQDATVSIVESGPSNGRTWKISIVVQAYEQTESFAFTLAVDAVTVTLLTTGANG